MSIFICGIFDLSETLEIPDVKRLGWLISDAAHAEGLHLHLFSAIPQNIVFEILGFKFDGHDYRQIPFLATDSPAWNVSDELVENQAAAMATLAKLSRTLRTLAITVARSKIVGADIYFSEGYDDNFESIEATLGDFEATVLARLEPELDLEIPSIRVRLRWGEGF